MGRSSSASTTSNVQDIDTQQIEAAGGVGIGLSGVELGMGSSLALNLTDEGAVDSAFDFADSFGGKALETVQQTSRQAFDFSGEFGADALEANSMVTRQAIGELGSAITKVGDATRSDTTETFRRVALYGAIAAAVIVVGLAIARRGR
jgi:hypothetical protein